MPSSIDLEFPTIGVIYIPQLIYGMATMGSVRSVKIPTGRYPIIKENPKSYIIACIKYKKNSNYTLYSVRIDKHIITDFNAENKGKFTIRINV